MSLRNEFDVEAVTLDANKISDLVLQHKIVLEQLSLAEAQHNIAAYCINLNALDVLEKKLETTLNIRRTLKKQLAGNKLNHKSLADFMSEEFSKKELSERQTLGRKSSIIGLGDFFKHYSPKPVTVIANESEGMQFLTLKK